MCLTNIVTHRTKILIVYDEKYISDWQCHKTGFASDEVKLKFYKNQIKLFVSLFFDEILK